jgi:hypothetical protein
MCVQEPDPEDGARVPEATRPAISTRQMPPGFGLAPVMRSGRSCGERARPILAFSASLLLSAHEPMGSLLWVRGVRLYPFADKIGVKSSVADP